MKPFHTVKKKKKSPLNMLKQDVYVNNSLKAYSIRKHNYDRYYLLSENISINFVKIYFTQENHNTVENSLQQISPKSVNVHEIFYFALHVMNRISRHPVISKILVKFNR